MASEDADDGGTGRHTRLEQPRDRRSGGRLTKNGLLAGEEAVGLEDLFVSYGPDQAP